MTSRAARSGSMPFGEEVVRFIRYVEGRPAPIAVNAMATLSHDPPLFYTRGASHRLVLGFATVFAARFGNVPAGFMIGFSWSMEKPKIAAEIATIAAAHRKRFPNHLLVFLNNTQGEAELLRDQGEPSILLNQNITVSETIFRPLPKAIVAFDAVYIARLDPFKRHELAAEVERLACVTYGNWWEPSSDAPKRLLADILARNPTHRLLNPLVDGLPTILSPAEVNAAINRAAVGLCLSAVEGANLASMEYMLAGLPVVSTPSKGGRDVYFDPEYCLICEPNPRAVRDAVAALKAREIPREYVRTRTLAKIEPGRRSFLDLTDDLIERLGGQRRYSGPWPFSSWSPFAVWKPTETHLAEFERGESRPLDRGIGASLLSSAPGGRVLRRMHE